MSGLPFFFHMFLWITNFLFCSATSGVTSFLHVFFDILIHMSLLFGYKKSTFFIKVLIHVSLFYLPYRCNAIPPIDGL